MGGDRAITTLALRVENIDDIVPAFPPCLETQQVRVSSQKAVANTTNTLE
jgi:hypothetical protein